MDMQTIGVTREKFEEMRIISGEEEARTGDFGDEDVRFQYNTGQWGIYVNGVPFLLKVIEDMPRSKRKHFMKHAQREVRQKAKCDPMMMVTDRQTRNQRKKQRQKSKKKRK